MGAEFKRLAMVVFEPLLSYVDEIEEKDELPEELPDELWNAASEVDS